MEPEPTAGKKLLSKTFILLIKHGPNIIRKKFEIQSNGLNTVIKLQSEVCHNMGRL